MKHATTEAAALVRGGGSGRLLEGGGLYGLLVETVRDYAIFALDPSGNVLTWNEGARRIKGYEAAEIIGKNFSVFYPAEDLARGKTQMELEVAAREGRFEDEGWRLRKDGSRFWANVIITALYDDDGSLLGYAKVTRDLTERRAGEERAVADAKRLASAEASSRAKSEFLATLSHELRTPLNAISGYADLIEAGVGGPVTDRQREYITRIRSSQQHLLGIINNLLNYSRIEAGRETLEITSVLLHPLVERTMQLVLPQATTRGLTVEHVQCHDRVTATADSAKVEQIVLNLLSNAVKFTPSGGLVRVTCSVRDSRALVSVTDTGPGIAPAFQNVVFEPFVQLGRGLTSPVEGTGLGLSISRGLARRMGGEVMLESGPGAGSTFTLSLPVAR